MRHTAHRTAQTPRSAQLLLQRRGLSDRIRLSLGLLGALPTLPLVALLIGVLGLCAMSGAARAGSALITEPQIEGPLLPAEATQLRAAVQAALRAQPLDLIP